MPLPLSISVLGDSLAWAARFLLWPSHIVILVVLWAIGALYYTISLRPRFFSPLRGVTGPPVRVSLLGHFREIMRSEPGMAEMEWTREYGPVVRTVGPFGGERMILLRPEALQKILVSDWVDYERVGRRLSAGGTFTEQCNLAKTNEELTGACCGIRSTDNVWKRPQADASCDESSFLADEPHKP